MLEICLKDIKECCGLNIQTYFLEEDSCNNKPCIYVQSEQFVFWCTVINDNKIQHTRKYEENTKYKVEGMVALPVVCLDVFPTTKRIPSFPFIIFIIIIL